MLEPHHSLFLNLYNCLSYLPANQEEGKHTGPIQYGLPAAAQYKFVNEFIKIVLVFLYICVAHIVLGTWKKKITGC